MAVKPKNIVADINEETIDLYENRFICSLTDKISKLVAARRQYYHDALKTIDDNNAIWAMDRDYHTTSSFQFFNKISKNSSLGDDGSFRDKIADELNAIEDVEKKLRLIKRSEFYRTLHKKRKVVDPIQKTNILMFEFNYKFLQREDVVRGDFANNKIYDQMSKIEIIMGEKANNAKITTSQTKSSGMIDIRHDAFYFL